ncbi:MAG TPA: HD domain-containing protein [Pontiellaceae bacterium]|nr:HD domain-containing protein [Pontiellaceae bacterium]HPR83881.1 HD domain-containing protein [Pontiellaceae bacterium]
MTPEKLNRLTERFCTYTDRYRINGQLHPMHQLKLEHTLRVAADARSIAAGMNWPEEEICLAEAIGLFHDVARFPQFQQYRSFDDHKTVDHGDLGVQTLESENLLAGVTEESRALILHAVQHHNKKELPPGLTVHEERHLRLIRDADRLDIFFICWDSIRTGHIHDYPEIIINMDFNGPPTPAVLEQFERGEKIDYRGMKSMADRFVMQLSWMHDMSYASTGRLVRERGILDKFISVLPVKTDQLMRCFERTEAFLASA